MYAPIIQPPGAPMARLRVELVPSTCWTSTVRSYMSEHYWRKLSREELEMNARRCETCKGRCDREAVHCHEVWLYNETRHIQELQRLSALCMMCHYVKHLGRSIALGHERQATGWLARVNGWNAATTAWYVDAVFAQWRERSRHEWALDLSVLGDIYEVPLERLGLDKWKLTPAERNQMRHRGPTSISNISQPGSPRPRGSGPRGTRQESDAMPRMTEWRELPKPSRPKIDWVAIAESERVWEFVEGVDFKGSVENFRARKKTEARRVGVDFNSRRKQRSGKTVLLVLAFKLSVAPERGRPPTENESDEDDGLNAA